MRKKAAYFVGIKGIAMTAMAVYLKEKGYAVTGSDVEEIFPTDKILNSYHLKVKRGFTPENIKKHYDLVIVTGAHGGMTNIEAQEAKKRGLKTLMHGEALGLLMEGHIGLSVAGCHGKTTTSSLTALLLKKAGFDPSYIIGTANINGLGAGGHFGKDNFFIAEADEYMTCPLTCPIPRFFWQKPKVLIITNIEYDHPDAFRSLQETKKAFLEMTERVEENGVVIACIDNQNIQEIIKKIKRQVITYGFSPQADFSIRSFSFSSEASFMRIIQSKIDLGEFFLRLPGKHNLLNALAAMIAVNYLGIDWEILRENLKFYTGCNRRFEKIGEKKGVLFYDDYAHHPSEIKATLAAFRVWFPEKRIIVIFQPHTFSRTRALFFEFVQAFSQSNVAVITDIYPSKRESFDPTITSAKLVAEINRFKHNAVYKRNKEETLNFLRRTVKKGDIIVTMGAGDIYNWRDYFFQLL